MATGATLPNSPLGPSTLLIVDGHAYAYRAFYAIRQLTSPAGAPTNAIFGFIKMLVKVRSWLKPSHQVVVWDGGLAEERMAILPEYKAQRPSMPSDLERQLDEIVNYLAAANIASHCLEGVEADDWIATLTRHAVAGGGKVVIASSDKDFMQLVSPQVGLLNPNDKSETIWTIDQVRDKTGVEPSKIVDWLSLIGDTVDNIPGVAGVGPKTGAELIKQFGSLDAIYQATHDVKSEKLRNNLREAEALVRRNRQLIRLRDDLPAVFSLEQFAVKDVDRSRLRELYGRWGFRTLLQEIENQPAQQQGELI